MKWVIESSPYNNPHGAYLAKGVTTDLAILGWTT